MYVLGLFMLGGEIFAGIRLVANDEKAMYLMPMICSVMLFVLGVLLLNAWRHAEADRERYKRALHSDVAVMLGKATILASLTDLPNKDMLKTVENTAQLLVEKALKSADQGDLPYEELIDTVYHTQVHWTVLASALKNLLTGEWKTSKAPWADALAAEILKHTT